jgi:hypothetical protein
MTPKLDRLASKLDPACLVATGLRAGRLGAKKSSTGRDAGRYQEKKDDRQSPPQSLLTYFEVTIGKRES